MLAQWEYTNLTFINSTSVNLCFNLSSGAGVAGDLCNEVKPNARLIGLPAVDTVKGLERTPIAVVLTVREDSRVIYNETAACGEWQDSDATFIIKQRGDEFIVTDSLPSSLVSP